MTKDSLLLHLREALSYIDKEKPHSETAQPIQPPVPVDEIVNKLDDRLQARFYEFKNEIKQELEKTVDTKINAAEDKLKAELSQVKKENADLKKTVTLHQQFLESLDHTNRAKVAIITGVAEDQDLNINGQSADNDLEKCKLLFRKIDQDPHIVGISRLGNAFAWNNGPRPIKVEVGSSQARDALVLNAKKLKNRYDVDDPLNKIFIKKDQHPLIRNEWKRLYETKKREEEKPENQGRTVILDRKSRTVTLDGEIIDRFQNF